MKIVVKTLLIRERTFVVVQNDEGWYLAIEDKYITNGRVNTQLNGLQMHASKDLNECLRSTEASVDVDYLTSCGYTPMQAICAVHNIEYRPEFEEVK